MAGFLEVTLGGGHLGLALAAHRERLGVVGLASGDGLARLLAAPVGFLSFGA